MPGGRCGGAEWWGGGVTGWVVTVRHPPPALVRPLQTRLETWKHDPSSFALSSGDCGRRWQSLKPDMLVVAEECHATCYSYRCGGEAIAFPGTTLITGHPLLKMVKLRNGRFWNRFLDSFINVMLFCSNLGFSTPFGSSFHLASSQEMKPI